MGSNAGVKIFSRYSAYMWGAAVLLVVAGLVWEITISQWSQWHTLSNISITQTAQASAPTSQESVSVSTSTDSAGLYEYIEAIEGCGPYYEGACVNIRSGPGEEFPVVGRLRNGQVLKVQGEETAEGHTWYQILFDEALRYPERVSGGWFVSGDFVKTFLDDGDHEIGKDLAASTSKRILVDRSEQMLYAYDGEELFMQEPISTGLELTPTPRGTFTIYKMTPTRYMQGPIPGISDQYYDLPGVPWNMYFTYEGAVIHGAYWHDNFGSPWSHGCVNLPPQKAKELYEWAVIGTKVTVQD